MIPLFFFVCITFVFLSYLAAVTRVKALYWILVERIKTYLIPDFTELLWVFKILLPERVCSSLWRSVTRNLKVTAEAEATNSPYFTGLLSVAPSAVFLHNPGPSGALPTMGRDFPHQSLTKKIDLPAGQSDGRTFSVGPPFF